MFRRNQNSQSAKRREQQIQLPEEKPNSRFHIDKLEQRIAPVPGIGGGGTPGGGWYNNPFLSDDPPGPH